MSAISYQNSSTSCVQMSLDFTFSGAQFDAYTIAFGIRNVPRIETALGESFRVLKRGGRFLCLEFSHVDLPVLDRIYDAYSFSAIPALGKVVTGDGAAYRYLVESIRKFPHAELFADMIAAAGFACVDVTRLSGGVGGRDDNRRGSSGRLNLRSVGSGNAAFDRM